jgi:predicted adenine nucleotide alpha hydrolase (AANH) superfamily ATPase
LVSLFYYKKTSSKHSCNLGDNDGVFKVYLANPKIGDSSQYLIEKNVVERVSKEADVELAAQDV